MGEQTWQDLFQNFEVDMDQILQNSTKLAQITKFCRKILKTSLGGWSMSLSSLTLRFLRSFTEAFTAAKAASPQCNLEPTKFVILRILDFVDQNLSKFDDFGVFWKAGIEIYPNWWLDFGERCQISKFCQNPNFEVHQNCQFHQISNFSISSKFDQKSKFRHGGLL